MEGKSNKDEKKTPKNFRLPSDTISTIQELALFFDESQAEVIERATKFLNNNRKLAIDQEREQRLNQIGGK